MGRIVLQVPFVWSALLFGLLGCATYSPPESVSVSFDRRAQTQADEHVRVSVLSAEECRAVFGVALYDVGVQPVWIQIENLDRVPYVLFDAHIDTQKFSPMEAAHRIARSQVQTGSDRLNMGAIKRAIAVIYTTAAIAALVIGFVVVPRDPLNFIFAVVLGLSWTLLAGYIAGDARWFSLVVILGSLAFNAWVLWW